MAQTIGTGLEIDVTRRHWNLLPIVLALSLGGAAPALGQTMVQPLPVNIPAEDNLDSTAQQQMGEFVAAHKPRLSGDAVDVKRSRDALLQPLQGPRVTVRFRLAYAGLLNDSLRELAKAKNDQHAVSALRIAGELATPSSILIIRPALSDERPAVRYASAFAAARVFDAVARHDAAPTFEQLSGLLRDLNTLLAQENDQLVVDGLLLAFGAAAKVPEAKFKDQSLRAAAIDQLATTGSARLGAIAKAASPCDSLQVFQRATRAMRDALTDIAQPKLPAPVLAKISAFADEVLKAASALEKATPPCEPALLKSARDAAEAVKKFAN